MTDTTTSPNALKAALAMLAKPFRWLWDDIRQDAELADLGAEIFESGREPQTDREREALDHYERTLI